jgi:hypothetical protein
MGKAMKRFIAAAALVAAQWQPAHAQIILGSIPEEFRGDWCWQENTNGEKIFRTGACKGGRRRLCGWPIAPRSLRR